MKQKGWVRFVIDVDPTQLLYLEGALTEGKVSFMRDQGESFGRHATLDNRYAGQLYYIKMNHWIMAKEIVYNFLTDFKINKNKVQLLDGVGE